MSVNLIDRPAPDFSDVRIKATAVHEAGHAFLARVIGSQVDSVLVNADGTGLTSVRHRVSAPLRHRAAFAIAGAAAERKFHEVDIAAGRKPKDVAEYFSDGDRELIESFARQAYPDDFAKQAKFLWEAVDETIRLVEKGWTQIKSIARQLRSQGGVFLRETAPAKPDRSKLMARATDVLWGRGGTYP
jgi:hypothetical protein